MAYLCLEAIMKNTLLNIALVLVTFLFFACEKKSVSSCLTQAELLMEIRPDSAYRLLRNITHTEKLPLSEQARFNLLYSVAMEENGIRPASDSLISMAISYYQPAADSANWSKALLYAGYFNYYSGIVDKAITLFEQAAGCTPAVDSVKKSQAYRFLGFSYQLSSSPDSALNVHLKALTYITTAMNRRYRLTLLRDIARVYANTREPEKAVPLYFQIIDSLKLDTDNHFLSGVLNELSSVYAGMGNYKDALHYACEAKEKRLGRDEIPMHNLAIGKIFLNMNRADSARSYLMKALRSTNQYISNAAYGYLISLDEGLGDYKKAVDTLGKRANNSADLNNSINSDIMRQRYEEEKLKNENNLLKLSKRERELYLLWLVLFILLAIVVAYVLYTREKKRRMLKDQLREEQLLKEKAKQLESENLLLKKESELSVLREKGSLLRESLFKRMTLSDKIPSLGVSPKDDFGEATHRRIVLTEHDWQELIQTVNDAYDNFAVRLLSAYPLLNNNEIAFCCLLKIKITLKDLSDIYCISKAGITKKKSRLKKDKFGLDDTMLTLDDYLERF